jgi:predicted dehydrogenase
MSVVRIACIGCGFIGRRHLENVSAMPGVKLHACVDVRESAAQAFRGEFGGSYHTTEAERVFNDPDVDAVIIATHHDSHTPLALAAAAAGKHILLEKPAALTVEECAAIRDAVNRAGVVCSVNFKFRFAPVVMRVREVIPQPILIVGQLAMERMPDDLWVRDPVRGGGLLLATACHTVDMVCHLSGSHPVRIYAEGRGLDATVATVRFANGSIAALAAADVGENPYTGKWLHQVFDGTRSAVLYDHFRQVRFSGVEPGHFHACEELRADGTYGMLEDFIASIQTSRRPAVTIDDGLRATALALQLLKSVESTKPLEVTCDD